MNMMKYTILSAMVLGAMTLSACKKDNTAQGFSPSKPECIAPAKPGGGFDLTCKLAQSGLKDTGQLEKPMRVTYMPGGVGAVAYNKIVANDPANTDAIVAFSTGSLLNLAQGKFGENYTEDNVRWLAAVGTDYGMVAVNAESPIKNLQDLAEALKKDPKSISFGAGGSVGGQDWLQTAMMAKAAGINPKDMTYVALEGGGEAVTAVLGNHISVVSAGIAEMGPHIDSGKIRVLAVFAPERLEGKLKDIPTAKEQGFDVEWPVIRGYYMGPNVSDESYNWWKERFDAMMADPKFAELRASRDLLPFTMTGDELQALVKKTTEEMRVLSKEFELTEVKK